MRGLTSSAHMERKSIRTHPNLCDPWAFEMKLIQFENSNKTKKSKGWLNVVWKMYNNVRNSTKILANKLYKRNDEIVFKQLHRTQCIWLFFYLFIVCLFHLDSVLLLSVAVKCILIGGCVEVKWLLNSNFGLYVPIECLKLLNSFHYLFIAIQILMFFLWINRLRLCVCVCVCINHPIW